MATSRAQYLAEKTRQATGEGGWKKPPKRRPPKYQQEEEEVRPRKRMKVRPTAADHLAEEAAVAKDSPFVRPEGETRDVVVVPIEGGFDGWQYRDPGIPYVLAARRYRSRSLTPLKSGEKVAVTKKGRRVIIPTWAVLEHEYKPPEVDLPGTKLTPVGIRGGASTGRGVRDPREL